jgi:hypothetical protein
MTTIRPASRRCGAELLPKLLAQEEIAVGLVARLRVAQRRLSVTAHWSERLMLGHRVRHVSYLPGVPTPPALGSCCRCATGLAVVMGA